MKILDYYSLRARTLPVIIVLFPIIIYYTAVVTNYFSTIKAEDSIGYIIIAALSFLFSQIGREFGKRKEEKLFKTWGGKPTTLYFKYENNYLTPTTRKRYYEKLEKLIPSITFPSEAEEQADPEKAEEIYSSCTKFLLSQTRDKEKYQLLFTENVNYGFRRNLWGMKPFAIIIVSIIILLQTYLLIANKLLILQKEFYIPIVINAIILLLWVFIIKKEWVKTTAFEFAKQLLMAIDILLT